MDSSALTQLRHWAETRPRSVAINAPDHIPLTYAGLSEVMYNAGAGLRGHGIERGDVVGVVTPNGPLAATTFLAVSNASTAAPLNQAYREREFEFYMSDLNMKAVVLPEQVSKPAEKVAAKLGITVIRPQANPDRGAGAFDISGATRFTDPAEPDDIALILHTSGTTARPKIVPLSHRNLAASVAHIADTLKLTSEDDCLNVMPLFHIHGLAAAVLASLHAGGSVTCTPGFLAPEFFSWLAACRPTWYTAVPTMHQAVVERGRQRPPELPLSLRFARSSSSSLPPQVMAALETTLGVPVIEAYGMTEASHQMASNPLPPGVRKPGSVGPAAGPQIAIMNDAGDLVEQGESGEIVIAGPNVMDGYAGNPEANTEAFEAGWFRTGDLGRLDEDGYLFISGRKKEIINRGGETISPREIDEVLLDHPSVAQALTFAVPDSRLGEQIATAVVVESGAEDVDESDLRRFAAVHLSPAKVPRRVVFLDEIPKGPTGKLQRIGLAKRLGIEELDAADSSVPFTQPESTIEILLAALWRRILGVDRVSVHDHFLDLGGDSLLAVRLIAAIHDETGIEVTMLDLSDRATVADQAELIEDRLLGSEDGRG